MSRLCRRIIRISTKRFGSVRAVRGERPSLPQLPAKSVPLSLLLVRYWIVALHWSTISIWVVEVKAGPKGPSLSIVVHSQPLGRMARVVEDQLLKAREVPDPIPGMPLVEPVLAPDRVKDIEILGLGGRTQLPSRTDQAKTGQKPLRHVLE